MEEQMGVINELIERTVNTYTMLLRIKRYNKEENEELEREIKKYEVLLHTFGVNTDELK